MSCDLDRIFGKLAKNISAAEKKEFIFTADNVPSAPGQISTDRLILKKGHHGYEAYTSTRVDTLHFNAHKETYRQLGLCLLSALFHSKPKQIKLTLNHPKSQIKALIFDHKKIDPYVPGFEYEGGLKQYAYSVETPERHPINYSKGDWRLPGFRLVDDTEGSSKGKDDWWNSTVVWGCASAQGDMMFASLLLSISELEVKGKEFALESELGFGGVCSGSPEVTLWLPGGDGWDGD